MSQEELKQVASTNMQTWFDTLLTRDCKKVACLYSKDCTFLPTVSGEFKRCQEGAEDYFTHFLAKNPEGKVTEDAVVSICDNSYLHAGMYSFNLDIEGQRKEVRARFDYIWRKEGSEWKILHHHSSVRP